VALYLLDTHVLVRYADPSSADHDLVVFALGGSSEGGEDSMHPALTQLDHRPWPIPSGPWTWRQSWCDLLFAHWPVPVAALRPLVPPELTIQEFDGTSWVGVVPFRMAGVMRRPLPDLPWISAFPELNVRLYVECQGKPGVWFLSLDATNPLAVWAARRFFHLPYFRARMELKHNGEAVRYRSIRADDVALAFEGTYRPTSEPYLAQAGTLERWLTERYCLYALSPQGKLYRTEVHHHPWPLQDAEAEITRNDLLSPHGLQPSGPPPLLHFARHLDVVVWSPEAV
jgi:hypothetical protein